MKIVLKDAGSENLNDQNKKPADQNIKKGLTQIAKMQRKLYAFSVCVRNEIFKIVSR